MIDEKKLDGKKGGIDGSSENGSNEGSISEKNSPTEPAQSEDSGLKIKNLEARLSEVERTLLKAAEERDQWKSRCYSEASARENSKKIMLREMEEVKRYSLVNMAKGLVEVADDVHRLSCEMEKLESEESLIGYLQKKSQGNGGEDDKLSELLLQIKGCLEAAKINQRNMAGLLTKHKISRIYPLGQKFDHNYHQAVSQIDSPGAEEGEVVEVIQSGYSLDDRSLRAAMVAVAGKKKS